ncbi:hypothetical protein STRIP9103_01674, partial [Streptomyces ipomoeae 91-03]
MRASIGRSCRMDVRATLRCEKG